VTTVVREIEIFYTGMDPLPDEAEQRLGGGSSRS